MLPSKEGFLEASIERAVPLPGICSSSARSGLGVCPSSSRDSLLVAKPLELFSGVEKPSFMTLDDDIELIRIRSINPRDIKWFKILLNSLIITVQN